MTLTTLKEKYVSELAYRLGESFDTTDNAWIDKAIDRTYHATKEEILEGAWHEIDCPAHSNKMGKESDCDCLLSFIKEKSL